MLSRSPLFTLVMTIAIGLAACGAPTPSATPDPTATHIPVDRPVPTETHIPVDRPVPTGTPIRVDLTSAQRAAMQALSEAQGVSVDQIQLISTEAVDWPDGCLGVPRPGVFCLQGVVPGFRIRLSAMEKPYEYHTNQDGTSIALAN